MNCPECSNEMRYICSYQTDYEEPLHWCPGCGTIYYSMQFDVPRIRMFIRDREEYRKNPIITAINGNTRRNDNDNEG